jgi:osmotically-inducible protein OsmY
MDETQVAQISGPDQTRIVDQVQNALKDTGNPSFRIIEVSLNDGAITLNGRVPNYYLKSVAQETALTVHGVWWIVNNLEVIAPP